MKIPDGWVNYKAVGVKIEGTRFIAFKVPLKEQCVKRNLPPKEWFTPQSLVSELKDMGLKLGLVIDLTNTTKYYNKTDFLSQSVEYEKIFTEGHVVPSSIVCNRFKEIVNKFIDSNPDSDTLIGVHCTHGLNRTGYIVCRYMIDCLKKQPDSAIEAFGVARGHSIERENYLSALRFTSNSSSDSDTKRSGHNESENVKGNTNSEHREPCEYRKHSKSGNNDQYSGNEYKSSNNYTYSGNECKSGNFNNASYSNLQRGNSYGHNNYYNSDGYHNSGGYSDKQYAVAGWTVHNRDYRSSPYKRFSPDTNSRGQSRYRYNKSPHSWESRH